jgi:ATP-dependent helicase/nuclease subunit A
MNSQPRIVIAGAGTGKTYTLVETYLDALKRFRPSEILAITFTQKAAAEMRARVISRTNELNLSPRGLLSAPICTFHALCAQIVGDELGEFELLSPTDDERRCLQIAEQVILEMLDARETLMGHLLTRFNIRGTSDTPGLRDILVSLLSQIRESGLEPKDIIPPLQKGGRGDFDADEPAIAAQFRDRKESLKAQKLSREDKRATLDELLAEGAALCAQWTAPDTELVRDLLIAYAARLDGIRAESKKLGFSDLLHLSKQFIPKQRARFKCVLVDEYQDTSPIQEQIVQLLTREAELFVVGDPKQSIYGFRGADASVFQRVRGNTETLKLSRRSQGAVIDLVNLVALATIPGFGDSESLEAMHEHHGSAGAMLGKDWAQHIKQLLDTQKHQLEDIVILVRRIKAARHMAFELEKLGIPARIESGDNFYERQEIADMITALYWLINPNSAYAKLTLMRSPFCNLPDSALLEWESQSMPAIFDELRAQLGKLRLAEIIDRLISTGGFGEPQAIANLFKLRTLVIDVRENYEEVIKDLWERLDTVPKESLATPFTAGEAAIRIMTIHQSKGLEFPVVILADLASTIPSDASRIAFDPEVGLAVSHKNRPIALCAPESTEDRKRFPTPIDLVRQKQRSKAEAELPRLLYVALTRAKHSIYIVDLGEQDRGLSMMRLISQARQLDKELFDQLMPALHPEHS